ncbi:hypothetical protein [Bradyrhizobium murdochi]|uniref:hypothetical protein n=1 Tax=Bradyrhizobium murdochi TaxID=1038859 RepID=UPI0012EB3BB2|nr:hypothetical protein [Bradyrhizobium murdochi]
MFWAFSPILSVDPEKLRRLLDDEPTFSQTIDNLAERQGGMDPVDQLPTESLDTAELMGMLASPVRSPEDEVNQPDPYRPGAEQASLLPTESLDTAKLLEMIASGGHSPADSINQPSSMPSWTLENSTAGAAFQPRNRNVRCQHSSCIFRKDGSMVSSGRARTSRRNAAAWCAPGRSTAGDKI